MAVFSPSPRGIWSCLGKMIENGLSDRNYEKQKEMALAWKCPPSEKLVENKSPWLRHRKTGGKGSFLPYWVSQPGDGVTQCKKNGSEIVLLRKIGRKRVPLAEITKKQEGMVFSYRTGFSSQGLVRLSVRNVNLKLSSIGKLGRKSILPGRNHGNSSLPPGGKTPPAMR